MRLIESSINKHFIITSIISGGTILGAVLGSILSEPTPAHFFSGLIGLCVFTFTQLELCLWVRVYEFTKIEYKHFSEKTVVEVDGFNWELTTLGKIRAIENISPEKHYLKRHENYVSKDVYVWFVDKGTKEEIV